MTSKERMLTAINHKQPDRVPTGEWGFGRELLTPVLGREPLCFNGLRTLKAFWEGRRDEVVSEWKHGLVEITRKLGWDAVLVHLMIDKNARVDVPEKIGDKRWRYENGAEILYSEETNRVFTVKGGEPGKGAPDVSAPSGPVVNEVENRVELYTDPDAWKEKQMNGLSSLADKVKTAKNGGMDWIACSCDYGTTGGAFMSPEMFRKANFPFLEKYIEIAHEHGLVFLHHACGNNQNLMT